MWGSLRLAPIIYSCSSRALRASRASFGRTTQTERLFARCGIYIRLLPDQWQPVNNTEHNRRWRLQVLYELFLSLLSLAASFRRRSWTAAINAALLWRGRPALLLGRHQRKFALGCVNLSLHWLPVPAYPAMRRRFATMPVFLCWCLWPESKAAGITWSAHSLVMCHRSLCTLSSFHGSTSTLPTTIRRRCIIPS